MRRAEAATLSSLLRDATDRLSASGVESARADAERLTAHAMGIDWGELWAGLRDHVVDDAVGTLDAYVSRRAAGEPLAYITGSTVFYGREIDCGPGVLVPRPETETLVDAALGLIAGIVHPMVVDVGTGSGAIAVAIAAEREDAVVWAVERSDDALRWAERNIAKHGAGVLLRPGDLFEPLPLELRGRFDLVVSNPPYVASGAGLPIDVLAEPEIALYAGSDGLDVARRLVEQARAWLGQDGCLALEIGTPEQARAVAGALESWRDLSVRDDRAGRPRVVTARR